MPMISKAFDDTHLSIQDIDLLVCDKGPGSFTGIRIGIATVKAFHDSLDIPCVGISSLEALAYSIKKEGLIFSIIDCKNDNCYFALYEYKNSKYNELIPPTAESVLNAINLCNNFLNENTFVSVVGDGVFSYKDLINDNLKANLEFSKNNDLDSYCLALAGLAKYENIKSENILPLYLKKPQAQRILEEKLINLQLNDMTLDDLFSISDNLQNDFDDFWNFSTLKDELCANNSKYIVAKLDSQIVGFAGFKVLVEEADIMNIVVRKDFRYQGVGSLLLENLLALCKNMNISSVSLEVMEENYPAIHLYSKFGFVPCGVRKNYYKDKNAIIMKKRKS